MHFDAAALVGLAVCERNAVDVLVDADEREAQFGLARIAVGVAPDQACGPRNNSEASLRRHMKWRPTTMKPGTA